MADEMEALPQHENDEVEETEELLVEVEPVEVAQVQPMAPSNGGVS
jgi:hypothetical protein